MPALGEDERRVPLPVWAWECMCTLDSCLGSCTPAPHTWRSCPAGVSVSISLVFGAPGCLARPRSIVVALPELDRLRASCTKVICPSQLGFWHSRKFAYWLYIIKTIWWLTSSREFSENFKLKKFLAKSCPGGRPWGQTPSSANQSQEVCIPLPTGSQAHTGRRVFPRHQGWKSICRKPGPRSLALRFRAQLKTTTAFTALR